MEDLKRYPLLAYLASPTTERRAEAARHYELPSVSVPLVSAASAVIFRREIGRLFEEASEKLGAAERERDARIDELEQALSELNNHDASQEVVELRKKLGAAEREIARLRNALQAERSKT